MFIVTAKQMQAIDKETIEQVGVPGTDLMERAGVLTVKAASDRFGDPKGKPVVILCGKGNNGGDGFVAGRLLLSAGATVSLFLAGHPADVKGDARINLDAFSGAGGQVHTPDDLTGKRLEKDLANAHFVIDALFGTGLNQPLREPAADWVKKVEQAGRPVVSVDIPSGINADTGAAPGSAIKADLTVTFACPKRGHFQGPGADHTGALVVADIGIPQKVVQAAALPLALITPEAARERLPGRQHTAHKGSFGHVLVAGGSLGLTGAAVLAAKGSQAVGAGLVTVACPAGLNDIFEVKLTEAMTLAVAETPDHSFSPKGVEKLLEAARERSVTVLGPGISRHPETGETVRRFTTEYDGPLVLDADGLNAWAGHMGSFPKRPVPTVLTPHPGEMARLLGTSVPKVQADRMDAAMTFAHKYDVTLVLKGAHTVVADPYGLAFVNSTGSPALASGGTGDVLAGMIGGLIAQGRSAADAAVLAVFLHGLAADLWTDANGPVGLTASAVAARVPAAWSALAQGTVVSKAPRIGPLD